MPQFWAKESAYYSIFQCNAIPSAQQSNEGFLKGLLFLDVAECNRLRVQHSTCFLDASERTLFAK